MSRVFLSCVSADFEKDGAPYAGLRSELAGYLRRAGCDVKVQEDFRQTAVDTLEKLDDYIRQCSAVIHILGTQVGTVDPPAVQAFLRKPQNVHLLPNWPDLRKELGDFSDLTYTHWEAFLALHHGIPLYVYRTPDAPGDSLQKRHLDRLVMARRYAEEVRDRADLMGKVLADLPHLAHPDRPAPKIAVSRILRHSPPKLFGRDTELAALDDVWANPGVNVNSLIAWGGAGKTSLVTHWVGRLAQRGWPGIERYFDWSFYSQGTGESRQTSADLFIGKALEFFGDADPAQGSPWDRGQRLAGRIAQHRALLVLDGVEPLQYPVNEPQAGRIKDQGLQALLQGLAMHNPGLCLVTSRESLTDLDNFQATTAPQTKLDKLSREAALALLRHLQVVGSDAELEAAWRDAGGHALTLHLLGRFLSDAYGGDIRQRHKVHFEEMDKEHQGRSAFKVMLAYEKWLASAGPDRRRELAILRLTGLFDRPISPDCLKVLRTPPAIPGLTDTLVDLGDPQWNIALRRLIHLGLFAQPHAQAGSPHTPLDLPLDAHPLIREYFAKQLRENAPEAYRQAHSRLFDHLCRTTPHRPDSLDGLQPLYQAVVHGCLAGRHPEAREKVYRDRIQRGTGTDGFYSTRRLGAIGADLAAVAAFFEEPWSRLSPNLRESDQAWLLNQAAFSLRGLGRLTEALQLMRAGLDMRIKQGGWNSAATSASNLSELEVTLGMLEAAERDAIQAIEYADRDGHAFLRLVSRTTAADALLQAGQHAEAVKLFEQAEAMQLENEPQSGLLYSLRGFQYCDAILVPAERAAWRATLDSRHAQKHRPAADKAAADALDEAQRRATQTLEWTEQFGSLLSIALDHLTLARVCFLRRLLSQGPPPPESPNAHLAAALTGLRQASMSDELPKALLTAAWQAHLDGDPGRAKEHLDEAQGIAERGPMPLFLADVHLHRARLFHDRTALTQAAALIRQHGYGRRDEELADAQAAAEAW